VAGTSAGSLRTAAPGDGTGPVGAAPGGRRGWLLAALLGATFLGTVSNNIVNVPLRQITTDLGAPVTQGVLVAAAAVLVLAVAMPLTGWVTDRLGRRRTLVIALSVLLVGTLGAAVAPSLPLLVVSRAVQGLGCTAVPTAVMGTMARCWPADRRSRILGAWGAANGIGQAVGPPVGGLLADAWGWRSIFWVLVPITVLVLGLAWSAVPRDDARRVPMDWWGASSLTVGVAALMAAVTVAPQPGVPPWVPPAAAVLGSAGWCSSCGSGCAVPPRSSTRGCWSRSAGCAARSASSSSR
jgi:MFS family permease